MRWWVVGGGSGSGGGGEGGYVVWVVRQTRMRAEAGCYAHVRLELGFGF